MKFNIICLIISLFFLKALFGTSLKNSFQWPTKKVSISSTFGEPRYDHFHNGLDIPVYNKKIYPIQDGNIIWIKFQETGFNDEPIFGGGKTIVIQHQNIILSTYMHLNQTSINNNIAVNQHNSIGLSGNTGHSGGAHLHFSLYDSKKKMMINPLLILPKKNQNQEVYILDNKPPEIIQYFTQKNNNVTPHPTKKKKMFIEQSKKYALIFDRGVKKERWGIYSLEVFNNKQLIHSVTFSYLFYQDYRWLTKNKLNYEDIYYENLYSLGNAYITHVKLKGLFGPSIIIKNN